MKTVGCSLALPNASSRSGAANCNAPRSIPREHTLNTPSNDGLLRLQQGELSAMKLVHLISGIDDDAAPATHSPRCGSSTTLSGYTEWVSAQEPNLTLGWDWQLETDPMSSRVVRLGLPRTNVLVVKGEHDPLPWETSLEVLASFIDSFDWNTPAFDAVCERYAC